MITWTYKGKEYWESYNYYKGKSVSVRAYVNGRYMILKNGHITLSGKADNRSKAIEALEDYLYPTLIVVNDKEPIKEIVEQDTLQEEVIEHPIEGQIIQHPVGQNIGESDVIMSFSEGSDSFSVENTVKEEKEDKYKLSYTITKSSAEENCVVISINPLEGTTVKYTTNGKAVISSSKIYKGEFTVEKGTPINYAVFDEDKLKIDEGNFIGE